MPLADSRSFKQRELEALRNLEHAVESFRAFVARISPAFAKVPRHLRRLYALIEESRQRPLRITVSMPPRHGKTTTFFHALGWRVLYDPACLNFYATYGQDLAESTAYAVRKLVSERMEMPLAKDRQQLLDWRTIFGGGLKSTSVGGPITGRGANGGLIIVDDAVKGWEVAYSKSERDKIWQWFRSDVMSRLEGGASIIVCNTRWHEDDLIGRLKEDGLGEEWIHINLPAIGDEHGNPIDERIYPELARPLWLDVDSMNPGSVAAAMAWYAKCRARGEAQWWALYQGVPRSEEAKMFALDPPRFTEWGSQYLWEGKRGVMSLDPAATMKTTADRSALGAFSMDGYAEKSKMDVVDVASEQLSVPKVIALAMAWQKRYRLPLAVEAVGGFKAIPQMIRELEPKLRIIEINPVGDKKTRAIPVSDAWNGGRVWVPANAPWVEEYLWVMRRFTGIDDDRDDETDMTAHAWNTLYREMPSSRTSSYEAPDF